MGFISVKNNLINFLGTKAGSNFTVIGYSPSPQRSESLTKQLSVRYLKGENPKDINSMSADIEHFVTFEFILTVVSSATTNLAVIDDGSSTAQQLATAIANTTSANKLADDTLDTFYSQVLKIVMSPVNRDLGNQANKISSRWLDNFEKGQVYEDGENTVVIGKCYLTLYTDEVMEDPDEEGDLEVIDGQITTLDINGENEDTYTQTLIKEEH